MRNRAEGLLIGWVVARWAFGFEIKLDSRAPPAAALA